MTGQWRRRYELQCIGQATGELGAWRRIAAMATTTTAHRPLAWFELRRWQVSEVEEVMVELWAPVIEQWCYGGGTRAWRCCRRSGEPVMGDESPSLVMVLGLVAVWKHMLEGNNEV